MGAQERADGAPGVLVALQKISLSKGAISGYSLGQEEHSAELQLSGGLQHLYFSNSLSVTNCIPKETGPQSPEFLLLATENEEHGASVGVSLKKPQSVGYAG